MKRFRAKIIAACMAALLAALCAPEFLLAGPEETEDTTGVLPTIFLPRLSLRYEYVKPETGDYLRQLVLRGDYALQNRFLFRADLPFVSTELETGAESGLGDVMFRALWLAVAEKRFAVAAGTSLILDTAAESSLGTGKNVIVPLVAAAYSVSPRFWVFGVLQDAISFSGDEERKHVHTASLLPGFYYRGGWGGWLLLQPAVRTDLSADGDVTVTSEFEIGQKLSRQFALAIRTGFFLAGEKSEDYSLSGEVRYFFLRR